MPFLLSTYNTDASLNTQDKCGLLGKGFLVPPLPTLLRGACSFLLKTYTACCPDHC